MHSNGWIPLIDLVLARGHTSLVLSVPSLPAPDPHRGRKGEGKGSLGTLLPILMPRGADREGKETAASRTRRRTKGSECGKPGGRRGWEPEYPLGLDWEGAAFPTPRGMMSPQERARGQAAVLSRAWDLLRSQGFSTSGTQKGEGGVV